LQILILQIYPEKMATEIEASRPAGTTLRSFDEETEQFRSVSRAAIASIILAVLGSVGYFMPPMLGLLLLGLVAGVVGYFNTVRFPDEITGRKLAIVGALLCAGLFVSFTAMHIHTYLTEVPEGYQRLIWAELQPPRKDRNATVSERSLELDKAKVFMKGYVMQPKGSRKSNLKSFILVRDLGTCCFGDANPKPTHIVKVELPAGKTTDWNMNVRKLTGTFHVDSTLQPTEDVPGVYYQIKADTINK
jgi:hypothetical protein